MTSASEAAIVISARGLASIYWRLAEQLRDAAATLATVTEAGDALQLVPHEQLAQALQASMLLRYLADRREGGAR